MSPIQKGRKPASQAPRLSFAWAKPVLNAESGPHCGECATLGVEARTKEIGVKGSQKPKSAAKKPAQKSLKERRAEKKAAAKIRGIAE